MVTTVMNRLLFFIQLVAVVYGYFEVLEPSSLAGVYTTAPLRLNPIEFNITGELILADPENACAPLKNNVTGKIVMSVISFACTPEIKVKHIKDAGGIALALANYGLDNAHTGFVYYVFPKPGSVELPAINVAYLDNVIAAVRRGEEGIIVNMVNSTSNPWAEYGQSGVGIAMQVSLELIAFACLICGIYKLYFFVKKTGVQASISQLCLSFEILAALIRIIYFLQPLQFRNDVTGDDWNEFIEPMFVELAMPITFMTTLLVTFYWQDIFRHIDAQASVQFMKNLDHTKIPFIITVVILWLFQFVSILTRLQVITGVDIVYVLSAIVQLFNVFCVGTFFIITGIKMLKISSQIHRDKYQRLIVLVSVTGTMYVVGTFAVLFFLSGVNFGPRVLFVYWIYYGSLHIASLSKILGFETNVGRQFTKSSHTSMNQVELKTSSGFTMTSSEMLADSREHDFDDVDEQEDEENVM